MMSIPTTILQYTYAELSDESHHVPYYIVLNAWFLCSSSGKEICDSVKRQGGGLSWIALEIFYTGVVPLLCTCIVIIGMYCVVIVLRIVDTT